MCLNHGADVVLARRKTRGIKKLNRCNLWAGSFRVTVRTVCVSELNGNGERKPNPFSN
jgi:hypothetical protein